MKEIKRVRIQNEGGMGFQTKITDAETGDELIYVTSVTLEIQPKELVTAKIAVIMPILDIVADAEITHICPYCNQEVSQNKQEVSDET